MATANKCDCNIIQLMCVCGVVLFNVHCHGLYWIKLQENGVTSIAVC